LRGRRGPHASTGSRARAAHHLDPDPGLPSLVHESPYNWHDFSQPESALDGRPIHFSYRRRLGGSSSINGMAYMRCQWLDFDDWTSDISLAHSVVAKF
jgi:choline dehydrogenase-like flavoprotein